jgi:hypothetical protein
MSFRHHLASVVCRLSDEMCNLYRGPSIDASYQVSVHLAKQFQRRRFENIGLSERPCLLMNRDEMSNLYKGPSKDASYQVSIHLAKWFQRRPFFRNQATRNKNCLWRHVCQRIGTKWTIFIEDIPRMLHTKFRFIWPSGFREEDFLEIDQSETRTACGGHVCWWIGTLYGRFDVLSFLKAEWKVSDTGSAHWASSLCVHRKSKLATNTGKTTEPYATLMSYINCFSSPCQRQSELLPSLGVRRPLSVNFSHFNLLL